MRRTVSVLRAAAIGSLGAWLGVTAFFSFAVAPLVFRTVDRGVAGEIVAAVLPRYYGFGIGLCAIATLALAVMAAAPAGRRAAVGAAASAVTAALLVWALVVTLPAAEQARRGRDDAGFARAHRTAVRLNVAAMIAGVVGLVMAGVSPGGRGRR